MNWATFVAAIGVSVILLGIASSGRADEFPPAEKLPDRSDLPDPLVMLDGTRITTVRDWNEKRRPELKKLFEHYMYGTMPKPVAIRATVEREDANALGGKATLREVTIAFRPPDTPKIHLLLVLPKPRRESKPRGESSSFVGCFLGINFCGNHALLDDPKIRIPTSWMYDRYPGVVKNRATEAGRGKQIDVWNIEQTIDRGYAVATFYNGDVDPDHAGERDNIQKHIRVGDKPSPSDWGTIAAWAWGIHRAVDYLVTLKEIDAKRIAVVGHSRLGKTALLAAAFDERIALAIPHQAGCGGTAPSRGKVGESVKQINDRFPHWFNGNFKDFNGRPEKLPFDQHCLVALCAPRPVLFTNAVEDQWANPNGQFEVLKAADPVYRLLDAGGLDAKSTPELNQLVSSTLGYFIRPGQHSMTKGDWKVFLDFADRHLAKKATR
jgi:hypothetical protein